MLHICETCGEAAYFGKEVNFSGALASLAAGDKTQAKTRLGLWYCGAHRE
jgi:hypothetical protein